MLHLLRKPIEPVITRKQRLEEREKFAHDMRFMFMYGYIFCILFLIATIASVFADSELDTLQQEICENAPKSTLCTDFELLERIDAIATSKNVPTRLIVGIWNAESTIGTHFNKPICANYYNWAGLKGRKFDDGHVEMYAVKRLKPDINGCYLWKFDSIEQATESLANTIGVGYKGCNNKPECIAYDFVGKPDIAEPSWVKNVNKYYKNT